MSPEPWDGRPNPHAHAAEEGIRYFASGAFPHYFDADPWEQTTLAADPRHAHTLAALKQTLRQELTPLPHAFGEFTT